MNCKDLWCLEWCSGWALTSKKDLLYIPHRVEWFPACGLSPEVKTQTFYRTALIGSDGWNRNYHDDFGNLQWTQGGSVVSICVSLILDTLKLIVECYCDVSIATIYQVNVQIQLHCMSEEVFINMRVQKTAGKICISSISVRRGKS